MMATVMASQMFAEDSTATVEFLADYQHIQKGRIRRGRILTIKYAPERLPQIRYHHREAACWDIEVCVRFHPNDEVYRTSVMKEVRYHGDVGAVIDRIPAPIDILVPSEAKQIELWFRNFNTYYGDRERGECGAFDSCYCQNYWFTVETV
jgi:hypothetical protein